MGFDPKISGLSIYWSITPLSYWDIDCESEILKNLDLI